MTFKFPLFNLHTLFMYVEGVNSLSEISHNFCSRNWKNVSSGDKGLIREPPSGVVLPGRPCRPHPVTVTPATTAATARPVPSEGPQARRPPCAAVSSWPGCLLTPWPERALRGDWGSGRWGPGTPDAINTAAFPDLQPFLRPCLLGTSSV